MLTLVNSRLLSLLYLIYGARQSCLFLHLKLALVPPNLFVPGFTNCLLSLIAGAQGSEENGNGPKNYF